MDTLYLVQLDEIPAMLRWVELSRQAGYLSAEDFDRWVRPEGLLGPGSA